jgi:subtilisin family serine protease
MTSVHRNHHRRIAAGVLGVATALTFGSAAFAAPANAAAPAQATAPIVGENAPGAIKDNYIVVFRADSAEARRVAAAAGELAEEYGADVRRAYGTAVKGFSATMTAAEARRLAADPAVEYVEQDRVVTMSTSQTSPPWGLDRIDQRALPLTKTYGYAGTTSNVTAYVLDTGIRTTHKDFGGRARNGYDFIDNDAVADDCNGHGTHVAGTVGGKTYGAAKEAKLVGVKVLNCQGVGRYSQMIAGIDWVTAHAVKPAVANMSLGGTASKALDDAVRRSIASGVTYVLAAGNENVDACTKSPARTAEAITVGATDSADRRASFSNWGTCLDIFAPGARILSTSKAGDTATATMSGTSMAAPHVAGAAAVVLAASPNATPAQVRDALVNGATTGKVTGAGAGSPNRLLYGAVKVSGGTTTPPTTASTVCQKKQTTNVRTMAKKSVTSALTVDCAGKASAKTKVAVNIKHTYRGSLVIDLVAPTGKGLRLKSASSDTGDNIVATYTVNASAYARKGTWKLKVTDTRSGHTGYLDAWTLTL